MKTAHSLVLGMLAVPLLLAGCKDNPSKGPAVKPDAIPAKAAEVKPNSTAPQGEDSTKAALAKLGPEDQQLAEAQGFCPKSGEPLGAMGVPVKVMLKGKPVFLCCDGCEEYARGHADQMLAKVEQLKTKAKTHAAQPPQPGK